MPCAWSASLADLRREARIRKCRAKRGVLLCVRFGKLSQRLGRLRILLLQRLRPLKAACAPIRVMPVRCSANPTSTASRLSP